MIRYQKFKIGFGGYLTCITYYIILYFVPIAKWVTQLQNKIKCHVIIKCWILHLHPLQEPHSESQNNAGSNSQLTSLWPFIENWFFNRRKWKIEEEKQQCLGSKGTIPEHYQESKGSPFLSTALHHPCLSIGSKIREGKISSETSCVKNNEMGCILSFPH